jgi:uncharacterized BrkB/YihY/UPF0761 family membrane protein
MVKKMSELCFRITKMADIAYISAISVIICLILAIISGKIFGTYTKEDHEKEKSEYSYGMFYVRVIIRFVIIIAYIAILLYILRNVMEHLPSPFHGICGLDHYRVKELEVLPSVLFILLFSYIFWFAYYVSDELVIFDIKKLFGFNSSRSLNDKKENIPKNKIE